VTRETLGGAIIMSKIQLTPFVNFQGRAREAMEFYKKVLGGKLDLQTSNEEGRIAYARLEADGAVILGSDGHPSYPAKVGENVAIALGGSDKPRLSKIFEGLAEGGRVQMPLTAQPGGAEVGWLADRFGIHWTVSIYKA
jgi:PhnB protein